MLKWSNLEFTLGVGSSLVAADAMFLEPCMVMHLVNFLPGLNYIL